MSALRGTAKNFVTGYTGFMRRWQSREEAGGSGVTITKGAGCNINFTGEPDCAASHMLTKWHPSFADSLEPGVKDLVERLIESWDCVTYSSCQGHPSAPTEPLRIRNVRIGTRSRLEHARLTERARRLCDRVNCSIGVGGAWLDCRESSLDLDDGIEAPSLDLLFLPRLDDEAFYWRDIDAAYSRTLEALGEGGGDTAR